MTAGTPVLMAWARGEEVPSDDGWLTPLEAARSASLRFPGRRRDWRLGRWAAKRAVLAALHRDDPASVEVRAADDGAPDVLLDGRLAPMSISLSHRDGVAVAVVAGKAVRVGVDLEVVEPRTDAFVRDYLTEPEQAFVLSEPAERDLRTALVWAAKEAALKALRLGLRADPRSVAVRLPDAAGVNGWQPVATDAPDGMSFAGWWRHRAGRVITVVARPRPEVPTELPAEVARARPPHPEVSSWP